MEMNTMVAHIQTLSYDAFYIKLFYQQKQNSSPKFFMLPNTAYPKQPFPCFWNQ